MGKSNLVEVSLTQKQVDLLFPALKAAESQFTTDGKFAACEKLSVMYDTLRKQIYTYERVD